MFEGFSSDAWERLYGLSVKQGVVAVIFDKLKRLPQEVAPPKALLMKWLRHTLSVERKMVEKRDAAVDFSGLLSKRGIRTVVLKGIAFASYYPNLYHREYGDLDCYMFGMNEAGDEAAVIAGAKKKDAGYKHSHLYYRGLTIENHTYLTSFDNSKYGIKTELLLRQLIEDGCTYIDGTDLLIPSAEFNAIFLIKHAQRHFIKEGLCVRHVLDWGFFLKAEAENINWDRVVSMMKECRILNFAKVMTSLCVVRLGMPVDVQELGGCAVDDAAVYADILAGYPDLHHENLKQKAARIVRRCYRMWKFRSLAHESYCRLILNSLLFNSYIKIKPRI